MAAVFDRGLAGAGGAYLKPDWPARGSRDVDEEIAAHLEERRAEYAAKRAVARRGGGGRGAEIRRREGVAEACRLIDAALPRPGKAEAHAPDLRQDLGYALRLFRRNPGFAAIAILTLALGMGATTTIFTLANWALLRPVPGVTDPANVSADLGRDRPPTAARSASGLSYPNLADVVGAAANRDARRVCGLRRAGGRRRPGGAQHRRSSA